MVIICELNIIFFVIFALLYFSVKYVIDGQKI